MEGNKVIQQPKNVLLLKKKSFKYQQFLSWNGLINLQELVELFPGVEKIHPEFFRPKDTFSWKSEI